ncbi:MAG: rRNA adenine N-6-methyltransferase family protein, partial [Chloroflexota bacterium]
VLRHFLESPAQPRLMLVMVQKEVAQAVAAPPGDMSILAVSVQLYGHPTIVARVPPQSFYPPPRVDSALVRIQVYPRPAVEVPDVSLFFQVVRAGFSTPRKQLRNALANGLGIPPAQAQRLLEKASVSPQRRAQTLSLPEWAALCQAWDREKE